MAWASRASWAPGTTTEGPWASCPVSGCGRCASSTSRARRRCRGCSAASTGWPTSATPMTATSPSSRARRCRSRSVAPSDRPIPDGDCGRHPLDLIHQAICRIERQGTILVAAAGNYGQKAARRRPAGYQQVITVSAMADFDGRPGGKGHQSAACTGQGRRPSRTTGSRRSRPTAREWTSSPPASASGSPSVASHTPGSRGRPSPPRWCWVRRCCTASGIPPAKPNQVRQALIYSGRHDWRLSSDPDASHEPKVDVRHFAPPPTFSYAHAVTTDHRARRRRPEPHAPGPPALRPHRADQDPRRSTRRAASGSPWTAPRSPSMPAASADDGTYGRVTLRASDGEVGRTIHIPIRVTRHQSG